MTAMRDLHFVSGQWEPVEAVPGMDDTQDLDDHLRSLGWEKFHGLGGEHSHLQVMSWRRFREDRSAEYLVQVWDSAECSPFMLIDTYPEFMDLLARWAPAMQAAAVVGLLDELGTHLTRGGLVEGLAARVRFGIEEDYDRAYREFRQLEEERRQRGRERREQRAAAVAAKRQGDG